MDKIRSVRVAGVLTVFITMTIIAVFSIATYAAPINTTDTASQNEEENSTTSSDEAGWMQASKVYAAENTQPENTVAMQTCEKRQPGIQKKIAAIAAGADKYENKLTAVYTAVLQLRDEKKLNSPEIDTLVMTATSVKEKRVDPILEQLMSYETRQKVACTAGVENVILALIQVQSTTDQLRDGLAEYRNSIKAVVFAIRDYSMEATR